MKLNNKLNNLSTYPFHMPGHKRNKKYNITGSEIDITEIDGFDNLHNTKDILFELENDISKLYKYEKSIISVNGSTCGILSAISAVSHKGDKIIIARNCHKSVYNACYINELDVSYIEPEFNSEFGCYGAVTQKAVDDAIKKAPNACAIVITSPTYEGIISNIKCDIPLIIDAAHGAHFGFAKWLPKKQDADIIVQSLHKTLPCLTQCAVIHINNSAMFSNVKKYMDIYETSSPSYVLMNSIDKCIDFLKSSNDDFDKYKQNLDYFYSKVSEIDGIKLLKNDDITRIVLSVNGYTGTELTDILRNDFNIEVEGATINYVILISTIADEKYAFDILLNALRNIEKKTNKIIEISKPPILKKAFNSYEVENANITPFAKSANMVCAEYIYAYPPGCPIIATGEIITEEMIEYINYLYKNGVNILSDADLLPLNVLTKE